MRRIPLITAVLSLFFSSVALAQSWIEYASQPDFFSVNFPGEPDVRDIAYDTEYFITLPGRVYSYEDGPNHYSVTVVDYGEAEKEHAELVERCRAEGRDGDTCIERSALDLRAAIVHATWNFMQRDAEVTHFVYYQADRVEGHHLQLTNADGSRTYAAINMHENRLYILEGTVPANSPPPALFQQSLRFLDEEGKSIRYRSTYSNGFPPPPRVR